MIFLFFIQLALILVFVFLFIWQSIILIAVRNAIKTSKIPIPLFWLLASVGNLLFILIGLMAVLLLKVQSVG